MLDLSDDDLDWLTDKPDTGVEIDDRLKPKLEYSTHILVKNIPETFFMKSIKKTFSEFGTVGLIIQEPDEDSKENMKKARVTFNFPNEAAEAVNLGPVEHEGKMVQLDVERIAQPPAKRVVIRNLPRQLEDPVHLAYLFPMAEDIDIQNAGKQEMRCYVSFRHPNDALDAIQRTYLKNSYGEPVNVTIVLAPFSGKNKLRLMQRRKATKRKIEDGELDPSEIQGPVKRRKYGIRPREFHRGRGRGWRGRGQRGRGYRGRGNFQGRGYRGNYRPRRHYEQRYWEEDYYMYEYDNNAGWNDPYYEDEPQRGNFKILYEDETGTYERPRRERQSSRRSYSNQDFSI